MARSATLRQPSPRARAQARRRHRGAGVYLFDRLDASGRFECVDEVTLMLEGQEADRGLGRVR